MNKFKLTSEFKPKGDQPQAITQLVKGINSGKKHQVLLGVTGSGKTFTMANVIEKVQRPTLVLAPNKTLAAQLCSEFREYFPNNAVEYFVSYYDYYQPEAYMPTTDTYIEKDSSINDEIDRLRHSATRSLLTRKDVIVVASVSCIYGLGTPEEYTKFMVYLKKGNKIDRDELLKKLISIKYSRNDLAPERGMFSVKGDIVEISPAYERKIIRIEFFGDTIENIETRDRLTGRSKEIHKDIEIYPATHFVTDPAELNRSINNIKQELQERLKELKAKNKLLEQQRLEQRTKYDLEMIKEIGYCSGIENYSRHLDGRQPGEPPYTLLNYFPKDYLLFIDESHIAVPQLNGMYRGDQARKETLIEHGFRLPSAKDNRPLKFSEFEAKVNQLVYVSATPADYELQQVGGRFKVVEQIIRPTGLLDPKVEIRPMQGQVDDLILEAKKIIKKGERILVTTLTKKMSEDLTEYLTENEFKVRYMHSDIDTLDRLDILRGLRLGEFDILVGINLLREGLDLPEVSLVAVLDADKEGFLRAERSLIQTIGRAARNAKGKVILYADKMTGSIKSAVQETNRRRKIQAEFNKKHKITPQTIKKAVKDIRKRDEVEVHKLAKNILPTQLLEIIARLEKDMLQAAENLEFEKAAVLRDQIEELKSRDQELLAPKKT
ncbi:excinuclease ABC subunit UvrB [Candidatus Margulisiibacteriota bacterium]